MIKLQESPDNEIMKDIIVFSDPLLNLRTLKNDLRKLLQRLNILRRLLFLLLNCGLGPSWSTTLLSRLRARQFLAVLTYDFELTVL